MQSLRCAVGAYRYWEMSDSSCTTVPCYVGLRAHMTHCHCTVLIGHPQGLQPSGHTPLGAGQWRSCCCAADVRPVPQQAQSEASSKGLRGRRCADSADGPGHVCEPHGSCAWHRAHHAVRPRGCHTLRSAGSALTMPWDGPQQQKQMYLKPLINVCQACTKGGCSS
jgi:hypothetical protein